MISHVLWFGPPPICKPFQVCEVQEASEHGRKHHLNGLQKYWPWHCMEPSDLLEDLSSYTEDTLQEAFVEDSSYTFSSHIPHTGLAPTRFSVGEKGREGSHLTTKMMTLDLHR